MRVLVFGGTGATGRLFVERALAAGHEVTLFVRDPQKVRATDRVRIIRGDARNPKEVATAVPGHDAVVNILGPTGRERFTHFIGDATRAMIEGMKHSGARRFLLVSAVGVGESRREAPFVFRAFVVSFLLRATYRDRTDAERVVMASDVDWTIVRPLYLTNEPPTGNCRTGAYGTDVGGMITRGDLAQFLVNQLEDQSFVRKAVAVSN